MSRVPLIVLASVVMAAFPAAAAAQDNSAIDEYLESVPSGGGHQGDPGDGSGGGGGPNSNGAGSGGSQGGQPLSPSNAAALESQGPAGAAAAGLAQATAPSQSSQPAGGAAGGSGGNSAAGGSGGESGDRASGSGSGLSDVVGSVVGGSDSGGLGPWLPILLVITLLAAIAVGIVRWRSGPSVPRGPGPGEASQA